MRKRQVILMCCLLTVTSIQGTNADTEDKSDDEVNQHHHHGNPDNNTHHHQHHQQHHGGDEVVLAAGGNISSVEVGPPDSHEAMNNREILAENININDKGNEAVDDLIIKNKREKDEPVRVKRSYEFLMGLVNNNSKYEVTKIDPSSPDDDGAVKERIAKDELRHPLQDLGVVTAEGRDEEHLRKRDGGGGVEASELLLELMVKIAAHPDHWDKVHKLLQKIDDDLLTSKQLVEDLGKAKIKIEPKQLQKSTTTAEIVQKKDATKEWPDLHDDGANNKAVIGDEGDVTASTTDGTGNRWQPQQLQQMTSPSRHKNNNNKSMYPRTFAYHRVTGRPLYLNKNPKAYIAVSVIAPKPMVESQKQPETGDLNLEKELRDLKPWTHSQNLNEMAKLRQRWNVNDHDDKN